MGFAQLKLYNMQMDMGQGLRTYDIETKVINLHEFKTNVIDL
jgi:hypothetical protein